MLIEMGMNQRNKLIKNNIFNVEIYSNSITKIYIVSINIVICVTEF